VAPPIMSDGSNMNGFASSDGDDEDIPEPPAVVGTWTFPMQGMFPAPRPWSGGNK